MVDPAARSYDGLVSVLIPTYRRTTFIATCLQSLRAQNDPALEIIVSDDTMDDSIEQIVGQFADLPIRYIRNVPPLGLIAKLNHFLGLARGEWAVVLCDDDLFEPGFVAMLRRRIAEHPAATTIRSRNRIIDESGSLLRLDPPVAEVSSPVEFLTQLFSPTSKTFTINLTGFAFRPALLSKLGGFAECHRAYLVDRFALARLGSVGTAVCHPQPLCGIRKHRQSISSSVDADYIASIASVRLLEAEVSSLLDGLEQATPEIAISEQVAKARAALAGFVTRNLTRSLDRGLMAVAMHPGKNAMVEIQRLAADIKRFGISDFRSLPIYRLLLKCPELIRLPAARLFFGLKQRRQR